MQPEHRSLAQAYLDHDPQVLSWFAGDWTDEEAWWRRHRGHRWPREQLASIHPELADPECRCVVTGQQPAYGGGPLYTLLKTAHALALTRRLRASGSRAVCIFWCASEDHDAGEADHADLVAHDGRIHRLRMALRRPGASSRHQAAMSGWADVVATCRSLFPNGLGADFLQDLAPHDDQGLGAWLCRLIAAVFDDPHLRCIEAHTLRPLWTDQADQLAAAWPATALKQRRQAIIAAGYADALGPLPAAPLFRDTPDGRWPIDQPASCPPDQLSSGAALRPIVQQLCLPCCAYVGGPGEIAYHAQLGPAYEALGAPMPLLVPRLGGALLPPRLARGFATWNRDPHTIEADSGEPQLPSPIDLEPLARQIGDLAHSDPDTARRLHTARQRLQRELERLRASLQRGERQRRQRPPFAQLRDQLYPRGIKQERVMSSFQAIWEHGPGLGWLLAAAAEEPDPHRRRIIPL